MSIKSQIDRLVAAKAAVISEIRAKGVSVPNGTSVDELGNYVAQIDIADYNLIFVRSDGLTLTGEEVEEMEVPQGEIVQIKNTSGDILWEYTPPAYKPVLNDNSWDLISKASSSGVASSLWSVGDRKSIYLNGTVGTISVGGTYYTYIIGFNHNGATGIDFGTFKTAASGGVDVCLTDGNYEAASTNGTKYFNMNHSSGANTGGWKSCNLRYDILGSTNASGGDAGVTTATNPVSNTLMAALPVDLRAFMKPITVYTDNTGGQTNNAGYVTATIDYLPLMAEYEVHGARNYANTSEANYQAQYAYYKAGNSKMKYKHSATTENAHWWTRSPGMYSGMFCAVSIWGMAHAIICSNSNGLAPIFRV